MTLTHLCFLLSWLISVHVFLEHLTSLSRESRHLSLMCFTLPNKAHRTGKLKPANTFSAFCLIRMCQREWMQLTEQEILF